MLTALLGILDHPKNVRGENAFSQAAWSIPGVQWTRGGLSLLFGLQGRNSGTRSEAQLCPLLNVLTSLSFCFSMCGEGGHPRLLLGWQ